MAKKSKKITQQNVAATWISRIEKAEKKLQKYRDKCGTVTKEFTDDRSNLSEISKVNILWSNEQTTRPLIYARPPKSEIIKRFQDKGLAESLAAEIKERVTNFHIDNYDFHRVFLAARDDYSLYSRGVVWARYFADVKKVPGKRINIQITSTAEDGAPDQILGENGEEIPLDADVQTDEQGQMYYEADDGYDDIQYEKVCLDYLHRDDFIHDPARNWEEVSWAGRKAYMDKAAVEKRFSKEIAESLLFEESEESEDSKIPDNKVCIYEIWDKSTKKVFWIHKEYSQAPLDEQPAPVSLRNFFPCAKPSYGTTTSDSLEPIPEFCLYQDLAYELNEISSRIRSIVTQIKVTGVYDSTHSELMDILSAASDGMMLPVTNWAGLVRDKGINSAFEVLDVAPYARVLEVLFAAREQLIAKITEVTGLSDIVRGYSKASETATAQELKGRYANLRIGSKQATFQDFVRETLEIVSDIIVEKFQPETLGMMAGVDQMSEEMQAVFPQAIELLKNDVLSTYKLDVETDSTREIDQKLEKETTNELIRSLGVFMQSGFGLAKENPVVLPVISSMLLQLVRKAKGGRQLEGELESLVEQVKQQAAQPPPPDPKMIEMQQKAQAEQRDYELEVKKLEADIQVKMKDLEIKEMKLQIEASKLQIESLRTQNESTSRELTVANSQPPRVVAGNPVNVDIPNIVINIPEPLPPVRVRKIAKFETDADGNRVAEMIEIPIEEPSAVEEFEPMEIN